MKNETIRRRISDSGLKYWEVADAVGIADTTFTKWLRHELPADKKREIMEVIDRLKSERS